MKYENAIFDKTNMIFMGYDTRSKKRKLKQTV